MSEKYLDKGKHTELPWVKVCEDEVGIVSREDTQEYGMRVPILQVFSDNPERDVDLIVTAVNYHHRLREALEEVLPDLLSSEITGHMLRYDGLRSLLAELDNLENGS